MSTAILSKQAQRAPSILIKAAMAVSGLGMALWLTLHMCGNLLWLAGPEWMNGYGHILRESGLLWPVRTLLVAAFIVHVLGAIFTTQRAHHARPIGYHVRSPSKRSLAAAVASRSMRWTGVVLLGFVIYHVGAVYGVWHPAFVADDGHHNLRVLMSRPLSASALVAATALIALHLAHGLVSSSITLGLVSRRRERLIKRVLYGWAGAISAGFTLPLIACWLGR